jgi:SAM-dependent methyltransferase
MHLGIEIRTAVKRLFGPRLTSCARQCLRQRVPEDGSLPVYGVCRKVDNCLFSSKTIWDGNRVEGTPFYFSRKRQPGIQMICEGTELRRVGDATYDCLLSSHCLEHIANPIKALLEWKRVLRRDGTLLLVLPHKGSTFDWRRPTTSLAHMVEDFQRNTREDDLTHLSEIMELHDLERDVEAGTIEQFRHRCEENLLHRAIHHHVFDTPTALAAVDYAKFQLSRVEFLKPYHIMILARRFEATPDNTEFLQIGAEYRRRSPFFSDRILSPGSGGDSLPPGI